MLKMLHPDVSKVDRVLHPCLRFFCSLTFTSLSLSPPLGTDWASVASPPLSGCWFSHLLQLQVACMHMSRREGVSRDS